MAAQFTFLEELVTQLCKIQQWFCSRYETDVKLFQVQKVWRSCEVVNWAFSAIKRYEEYVWQNPHLCVIETLFVSPLGKSEKTFHCHKYAFPENILKVPCGEQLKMDFANNVVDICVITVQTYHHTRKIYLFDVHLIYHLKVGHITFFQTLRLSPCNIQGTLSFLLGDPVSKHFPNTVTVVFHQMSSEVP